MEIKRSSTLFGDVKISQTIDGVETATIVATLSANINNNGSNYTINVNFINKDLIMATSENQEFYDAEYKSFEDAIKAEIN